MFWQFAAFWTKLETKNITSLLGHLTMSALDWTKLPSLTTLRAFDAVARSDSFSAAARSLNVTHAAVSQQVKVLEEYLDIVLVLRSPRGVSLTSSGQKLAASLRSGFTAIAQGVDSIREQDRARPVRVTTTSYFAETVLFSRIVSFWQANPQVEISFTPSDQALDIVGEGFDLAIRAGSGEWPELHTTFLLDCPTLACAAPSLVDDPMTDWSCVPWLITKDSTWEKAILRQCGIDVDSMEAVDIGDPSLAIGASEKGMGIVFNAEIHLQPQLDAGSLKVVPIPIAHTSSFFIVTPPWPPRGAAQSFISWLRAEFQDSPPPEQTPTNRK